MTSTRLLAQPSPASELLSAEPRPRLLVVGVRDRDLDAATLAWAAAEAVPHVDRLHVVHAHDPVRLDGCQWEPVMRWRDRCRLDAGQIVQQAVQRVRCSTSGLEVTGSAVAGSAEDVLLELSELVDLIVAGEGDPASAIVPHLQSRSGCAVVSVPARARWDAQGPVCVWAGAGSGDAAMEFAAHAAMRRGVALHVVSTGTPEAAVSAANPVLLAERQQHIDEQLSGWRSRHPGLALVSRLERDDGWRELAMTTSSLFVTDPALAGHRRPLTPSHAACPTAVVPPARRS